MRSSSSWAPEGSFASFLDRSLDALERELPAIYRAMCVTLAPREVSIAVGGEVVSVLCSADEARLIATPVQPAVEVRTSREAIVDLVDARSTLVASVLGDRVELRGKLDDLVAFHDGLHIYLHGAVRAPSFPDLLRQFRRSLTVDGPETHA